VLGDNHALFHNPASSCTTPKNPMHFGFKPLFMETVCSIVCVVTCSKESRS
jgi:hypothetical protein